MIEYIDWHKEMNVAITICDEKGTILYINDKAQKTFAKYGGIELLGKSVFDCHPEPSRTKLKMIMEKRIENTYTIEKNSIKKIIHQTPWFADGQYKGFVEFSIEIPQVMPNFIRA